MSTFTFITIIILIILFAYYLKPKYIYIIQKVEVDRHLCNIPAIAIWSTWMTGKHNYDPAKRKEIANKKLAKFAFRCLKRFTDITVASKYPNKVITISKIKIC